jgi:tryptophanyl-tRNA synthetase
LFEAEKKFRKLINKIKTNSLEPGEPKDPEGCTLFAIYSAFTDEAQQAELRQKYADGIGWGDTKKFLFEFLNEELKDKRDEYNRLMDDPAELDRVLAIGAEKARNVATPFLADIRKKVGIGPMVG